MSSLLTSNINSLLYVLQIFFQVYDLSLILFGNFFLKRFFLNLCNHIFQSFPLCVLILKESSFCNMENGLDQGEIKPFGDC